MRDVDWRPVQQGDEYADSSDTHTAHLGKWDYYWSDTTMELRRYGPDGEYESARCRRRPRRGGEQGLSDLSITLQAVFNARKKHGTLLASEGA